MIGIFFWYLGFIILLDKLGVLIEFLISFIGLKLFKYVIKFSKLYLFLFNFCNVILCLLLVCGFVVWRNCNGFFKVVGVGSWICLMVFLFVIEVFVWRLRLMFVKGLFMKKLLINRKSIGRFNRRNFIWWLMGICIVRLGRWCFMFFFVDFG